MKIYAPSLMTASATRFQIARYIPILLVSMISFASYSRGLFHSFVAEDYLIVQQYSSSFSSAWQTMLESTRPWPVGTIYRWLLFQLFETSPVGFHLVSVLIHSVNVILIYILISRLSSDRRLGLGSAIIFALYPRHHQAILWMATNLTPLSVFFGLITLNLFERYLRTKRCVWYIFTLVFLVLALLSHETGVIVVPLFILLNWIIVAPEKSIDLYKWICLQKFKTSFKYIPIILIFILFLAFSFGGNRAFKLGNAQFQYVNELNDAGFNFGDTYHLSLSINSVKDIVVYATYAVFPIIPLRSLDQNFISIVLASISLISLTLIFIIGSNIVRFGITWLFTSTLPYVLFTPFGNADRYFYMMSIGSCIVLAWLSLKCLDWIRIALPTKYKVLYSIIFITYALGSQIIIHHHNNNWRTAGRIADAVLAQAVSIIPDPDPGSTIIYVNLPQEQGQSYIFMSAFVTAIKQKYGDRADGIDFYQCNDPITIAYLTNAPPVDKPMKDVRVLLYEGGYLVDKSSVINNMEPLQPSTFFQW